MTTFNIIAHTHWDREWHKTFQENRVRLIPFMDHLIDTILSKEDFVFTLDGQTSLIEDYLAVKPENRDRLKKAFATNRLIPGPWYVQPDTFLPSFESLVRNRLISKRIAVPFASEMQTGYLPDSFGQSAVIPSLLKGFDMPYALIYRGIDDDDTPYNAFNWKGIDGQKIVAEWMPKGYGNAMFLSPEKEKSEAVIKENMEMDLFNGRLVNDQFLLMSGSDQCFAKSHLCEAVKALNDSEIYKNDVFRLCGIDTHMAAVAKASSEMHTLSGEFRKGHYSRVHASIAGTRLDIKRDNFDLERLYESILEPLNALQFIDTNEDNVDIIQKGWKYIVENHAHDSICTVCTDDVHKEMRMRYLYANQIAHTLIDTQMEHLHGLIRYDAHAGRPIIVFNGTLARGTSVVKTTVFTKEKTFSIHEKDGTPVPYDIENQKTMNLKDTKVSLTPIPDDYYYETDITIPVKSEGIGYHTLYINEQGEPSHETTGTIKADHIENDHIAIKVQPDGRLSITDKVSGHTHENQLEFVDGGNAGDEYDYSPPKKDTLVSSKDRLINREIVKDGCVEKILRLTHRIEVPTNTTLEERSEETTPVDIMTDIILEPTSPYVKFKTTIENCVTNHRLQVRFQTDAPKPHHVADTQLGQIRRTNTHKETEQSMNDGWSERYYPTYSAHRYQGFTDVDKPFLVLNKGLPHYEIPNEQTIALTVLSGVGYMGNENLPYRPGRRSGAVCATPDAQLKGTFTAEYAFLPLREDVDHESLMTLYTNPPLVRNYAEYDTQGAWSDALSLFKANDLNSTILKVSEDKKRLALRTLNPYPTTLDSTVLTFNHHLFNHVDAANLAEDPIKDSTLSKGTINTPDEQDVPKLSGELTFKPMTHNAYKTLLFSVK